jgi:nucleoid-associated protein YgaU
MFKPDGTPLRARVTVTFSQVGEQPKPQNPTSHSEPRRVRVVREGERLDWIAHQEYGSAACWRHIALANDLADPADLQPGRVLQLPPLP